MLPVGDTTVAALLRGSLKAMPGTHVNGAAPNRDPANNNPTAVRYRNGNFRGLSDFINRSFALDFSGIERREPVLPSERESMQI